MAETQKRMERVFKFGESEYKSSKMLEIQCEIGGRKIFIRTIIVAGNIPWLIGRETMARMGMEIKLKERTVRIGAMGGIEVKVKEDSKGHMRMEMVRKVKPEEVWVDLGKNKKDRSNKIRKLHLQFGHPGWERLVKLIEQGSYRDFKKKKLER